VASLPEVDCVMAAIVGAAGLRATLAAARAGKKLLLANKEALVVAGPVFMETVRASGAMLLPIDSEHNAIFQCLPPFASGELVAKGIRRILLTGSGGPFRSRSRADLHRVTPDEACAHPNWVMGRKISVDSATMMNKGLEIIEARWLFGASPEQIQVVVHPQSVVHSMVEYADGSVIAQLGHPDMRTPIAQALAYPERIEAGVSSLDLFRIGLLSFEQPDFERFPALNLAYAALRSGGAAPATLNAANEIAVAAFLEVGHYLIARLFGVKVLRFSIGFGRPLWRIRSGRDRTEWVIAALPLGGYVKMLDEHEAPVAPEEAHRAFNRQRVWRRIAIVA